MGQWLVEGGLVAELLGYSRRQSEVPSRSEGTLPMAVQVGETLAKRRQVGTDLQILDLVVSEKFAINSESINSFY